MRSVVRTTVNCVHTKLCSHVLITILVYLDEDRRKAEERKQHHRLPFSKAFREFLGNKQILYE